MELSHAISLSVVSEAKAYTQTQCALLMKGNNTGIIVSGKILEATVAVTDDNYLLFLTDDIIFEESLNITLVNLKRGILESLQLGVQYATGTFESLHIEQDVVSFRFIGDITWWLKVRQSPSLRLPFSDPHGVSRSALFKKYIDISASPFSLLKV